MESIEPSCKERIHSRMLSRESFLNEVYNAVDNELQYEDQDPQDVLHEFPLGYSNYLVLKIELSTGGPADWLEVHSYGGTSPEVFRVIYHFSDWFDHAELNISQDSAMYRFAEETISMILES